MHYQSIFRQIPTTASRTSRLVVALVLMAVALLGAVGVQVATARTAGASGPKTIWTASAGDNNAFPWGTATDSSGNVYVCTRYWYSGPADNKLYKITPSGTTTVIVSNLSGCISLAVDPSGNIWALNQGTGQVVKIAQNGTETFYDPPSQSDKGYVENGNTAAMTMDAAGNVFVLAGSNTIYNRSFEITNAGVAVELPPPLLDLQNFMTVSPSGKILVGEYADPHLQDGIYEVTPETGAFALAYTLPSSYRVPLGMTFDEEGNLFVVGSGGGYGGKIYKFTPSGARIDTGLESNFGQAAWNSHTNELVIAQTFSGAPQTVKAFNPPATPTISWATPSAIYSNVPLSATQLDATASIPGTFDYTPALGATLSPGLDTLSVTFTPTDMVNYNQATSTVQIQVNAAPPAPVLVSVGHKVAGVASARWSASGTPLGRIMGYVAIARDSHGSVRGYCIGLRTHSKCRIHGLTTGQTYDVSVYAPVRVGTKRTGFTTVDSAESRKISVPIR